MYSSFNLNTCYHHHINAKYGILKRLIQLTSEKFHDPANWEKLVDQKDINAQVTVLNETILNVFRNYVPSKYIIINVKDPVWMNENIKSKTQTRNLLYLQYIQNTKFQCEFAFLETFISELTELISATKNLYYKTLEKN